MAALPVLAIGLQAVGTLFQGFSAMRAANYQAKVAQNNAIIAQQRADAARHKGVIDAETQDLKSRQVLGQQIAQQGASGIDISGRSFEDQRAGSRSLAALDRITTYNNAEQTANGFEVKKTEYLAEAEAKRAAGQSALFGSLLGVAGTVGPKWANYQKTGLLT